MMTRAGGLHAGRGFAPSFAPDEVRSWDLRRVKDGAAAGGGGGVVGGGSGALQFVPEPLTRFPLESRELERCAADVFSLDVLADGNASSAVKTPVSARERDADGRGSKGESLCHPPPPHLCLFTLLSLLALIDLAFSPGSCRRSSKTSTAARSSASFSRQPLPARGTITRMTYT